MGGNGTWRIERTDDLTTSVTLHGDFDGDECEDLRDALAAVSADARETQLDLSAVTFIGSRGLGAIIAAHGVAAERGATLVVTDASPAVRRLLDVTGTGYLLGAPGPTDAPTEERPPTG